MAIEAQNDVKSAREETLEDLVTAVNGLSNNLASDSTLQTGLEELQDLLIELNANINDGVPMTASDLSALEQITATIVGLPSDYPDEATHTKLDEVKTLLSSIYDEAVNSSTSLGTIDTYYTNSVIPDLDSIAGSSTDIATNSSLIADNTSNTSDSLDAANTKLQSIDTHVDGLEGLVGTTNSTLSSIDSHVDGLETLVGSTNTKLDTLHADVDGLEGLLTTSNTNTSNTASNTSSIANKLGTEGVTPPTITGTGIFGYVRAAYEQLLLMYGRMSDRTQKTQLTNGFLDVGVASYTDYPALFTTPATKTVSVSFVSASTQLPGGVGLNTDGYDTIEWVVTNSGQSLTTPQWSNDGVNWSAAQWYRWLDVSGPFNTAVSHTTSVRLTCKVQGHYFRLSTTTLTVNPTNIDITLSQKAFVAPVQKMTFDGTSQPVTLNATVGQATTVTNKLTVLTATLNQQTASTVTGAGSSVNTGGMSQWALQVTSTGSPTTVKVTLEGSINGTNWFPLVVWDTGAGQVLGDIVFAQNKACMFVRTNHNTISGGTSPNVTATWIGTQ